MTAIPDAEIITSIKDRLGSQYGAAKVRPSGVSCLNETIEIYGDGLEPIFVKLGKERLALYQSEVLGLEALRQCDQCRVPKVYYVDQLEHVDVLVMEFVGLHKLTAQKATQFGESLAALHEITSTQYGFEEDNYIGLTAQNNQWCDQWWTFFCEMRLAPQIERCGKNGMRSGLTASIFELMEKIPAAMVSHQPPASLLHGDLWSGNVAVDSHDVPVLFDPAAYYGDAETDLAMSQMFGALPSKVYEVYNQLRQPAPGSALRRSIYDLYHWLNHYNLFGVNYLGQVENTVQLITNEL